MPTGRGIALPADIADSQRGDGPPELVIRRKHRVVAMPMLPRRRTRSVSAAKSAAVTVRAEAVHQGDTAKQRVGRMRCLGIRSPACRRKQGAYGVTAIPETFALEPFLYYTDMFNATSSVLDVKDATKDAARNVTTLPVAYVAAATYTVSATAPATALSLYEVESCIDVAFGVWCSCKATYDDDASST
jgi:hypothetical protein